MLWNNGKSDANQRSFDEKQSKNQRRTAQQGHNAKQYLQLPTVSALPTNAHQKRNSFHGYAPSASSADFSPSSADGPPALLVSMMNGPNSYGSSLLQLPNGHNWSAVGSHEKVISPSPSGTSLSPSMLRSQTQQQPTTATPLASATAPGTMPLRSAAFARTDKALQQNAQQQQQQHNSTDSAPADAGISSEHKKRIELWAQTPSTAFHQSIDMRVSASDTACALSNSCGHIGADEAAAAACASGGRSGSINEGGGGPTNGGELAAASGYHWERRSAICSGGTSRDHHGRHQQHGTASGTGSTHQMLMFCTASGCSGHAPCAGHRPPPLRSTQSSIDESSGGELGMPGQLRDTYLTEISREWMRMNGAIAPFRNILQQASSVTNTPLPNHRPMAQSPAAPAAAAAASTASAILSAKAAAAAAVDDELGNSGGSGSQTLVEAIQGSCHNLATVTAAATTEQRIVNQFVRSRELIGSANDVAGGCGGSGDAVIIIEPRAMSQKRYGRSRTPSGTYSNPMR
ncbi:hypothetical protein niasHT_004808 [Heterodera trifolii]|uniref:Uncharacterized protein n=1 Tax=Heterodera trifolii TaxID=157864 RepID=A0ABD2M9S7_9BILA